MQQSLSKQSGTAVFMALLVVTLITTMSVAWFMQYRTNIRLTQQMLISEQAFLYAQGVVDWGISTLTEATQNTAPTWPKILPETAIAESKGTFSGRIDAKPNHLFLVRAEVMLNDQHLILYSTIELKMINGKSQIKVLQQSRGTF